MLIAREAEVTGAARWNSNFRLARARIAMIFDPVSCKGKSCFRHFAWLLAAHDPVRTHVYYTRRLRHDGVDERAIEKKQQLRIRARANPVGVKVFWHLNWMESPVSCTPRQCCFFTAVCARRYDFMPTLKRHFSCLTSRFTGIRQAPAAIKLEMNFPR